MTRDSPGAGGALDSSELRDLSTTPTTVRSAGITIIHPQLRDLLLPLERGRVLYPHGTDVEEQRWTDDSDGFGDHDAQTQSQVRTLHELKFTPTCLTSNGSMLACGGQKGELFLCDLPQTGKLRLAEPVQPFSLELRLPSRMINNAISILPAWPRGWLKRRAEWKRAYAGYAHGPLVDEFDESDSDRGDDDDVNDDSDEDDANDDNDEYMDYLEEGDDDDGDDETMHSPASSVATYPNTIPFGTRRMSRTSGAGPVSGAGQNAWNRSYPQRPQYVSSHGTHHRDSFVGRRGGSGRRSPVASSTTSSRRNRPHRDEPRILVSNNDKTVKMFSLRRLMNLDDRDRERDFRERDRDAATARADAQRERELYADMMLHGDSGNLDDWAPALSALRRTADRPGTGAHSDPRYHRLLEAMAGAPSLEPVRRAPLPPARPLFGSSYGYEGIGLNEGIIAQDLRPPPTPPLPPEVPRRPQAQPARSSEDIQLRDTRYLGESMSSYRARNPGAQEASEARARRDRQTRHMRAAELERRIGLAEGASSDAEACKLSAVGGTRFKLAVNHSSLSPDLRTMVTVGDSTDVYLHEVVDGGQHFRRIGVYNAATDCGFSTSWSKDGRKFAVASQDGQVTVWDHRSSRPLAIFHTQPQVPGNQHHLRADYAEQHRSMDLPVGSQSGLEAARVVKFSPEGSDRDLLVFSEELSRIHIVDARTFQTHIYLEVPYNAPGVAPSPSRLPRRGIEGGMYGISGVAFDPTGDWLYASTERTVVEWDMRRYGGGEGGTWSMA